MLWTKELDDKLFKLQAEGKTISQIADIVGSTRSAVGQRMSRVRNNKVSYLYKSTSSTPSIPASEIHQPKKVPFVSTFVKKIFPPFIQPQITKTLWLYDSHFPYNIHVGPLLEFIKDYKPDILGFGGDNWSLDVISHHDSAKHPNRGFNTIGKDFYDEAADYREHIADFMRAAPKAKFVYILGNHEDWIARWCINHPQLKDPDIRSLLGTVGKNIEFIPFGGFYQIGNIHFTHGHQFGSQNPAKQAVERCTKTIVIGHHHGYKIWPAFSMTDALSKHLGILVPCYCGLAPAYLKGSPNGWMNGWMNGFFTASIKRSGKFSPHVQLVSQKGHFMNQMGKVYE